MSSVGKNGIIFSNNLYEADAMYIAKLTSPSSYTPNTGTNSCLNPLSVVFDYTGTTAATVYRVIARVTWSGFDTSNTSGTFALRWQGSQYNTSGEKWEWTTGNAITNALNNQYYPTNLVLSKTSGSYEYNTTFILDATFRATYSGLFIGFRSDYSNGTGYITANSIMVLEDKYSSDGSAKAHFTNNYIACKEIIEI